METLLDDIYYEGPKIYSADKLAEECDLFRNRTALFYTPTDHIPSDMVGSGPLECELPIPFPTIFEFIEIMGYRVPKLWVDLIQRATGKIRWEPIRPAKMTLIRYDVMEYSIMNLHGFKALQDALKYSTTGRYDGGRLYYFGAIFDDNNDDLISCDIQQEKVCDLAKARTKIIVEPA